MAILENLENAWDDEFFFESKLIPAIDAMGREKIWEDENYPNLSVKIFSETCCTDCRCKDE